MTSKYPIPAYAMRRKGKFGDKCFEYVIVESNEERFISGSFVKEDMDYLLEILQNGNWYDKTSSTTDSVVSSDTSTTGEGFHQSGETMQETY